MRRGKVIRHYQFLGWYIDLYAPDESHPHLFTVQETQDLRIFVHAEKLPFESAFKKYCEIINRMSRKAGIECDHPDRRKVE